MYLAFVYNLMYLINLTTWCSSDRASYLLSYLFNNNTIKRAAVCAWRCFLNQQEPTSKWLPSGFQNVGFATAKHHVTEGRTRPWGGGGGLCLTSSKLQPSGLQNVGFATAHATEGRPGLPPAVAFAYRCGSNRRWGELYPNLGRW